MSQTIETKICEYFLISRKQRQTEVDAGLGLGGTQGYEDMGCYDCKGYNTNCSAYIPKDSNQEK